MSRIVLMTGGEFVRWASRRLGLNFIRLAASRPELAGIMYREIA